MKKLKPFEGMTPEETRMLLVLGAGAFMLSGSLYGINVARPSTGTAKRRITPIAYGVRIARLTGAVAVRVSHQLGNALGPIVMTEHCHGVALVALDQVPLCIHAGKRAVFGNGLRSLGQ